MAGVSTCPRALLSENGFVVLPKAVSGATLALLRAEVDQARPARERGGYCIWAPSCKLPPALQRWSATEGAELVRSALPAQCSSSAAELRCSGGAALWKTPGEHVGTPFHQDDAYQDDPSEVRRACSLWLALSAADSTSGCLRFAPELGLDLLPHERVPRDEAPCGFENFLRRGSGAEARVHSCAVDVPVAAGDVIVFGGRVVHGSHAATSSERVAFQPLFEWA